MSLNQAEKYFGMMKSGKMKTASKIQIAISLTNNLYKYVFNDSNDIFDVPNKEAMRSLIKSRSKPPTAQYTTEYFNRVLNGANKAHGSLREKTIIAFDGNKVIFYIPREATTRTKTSKAGKTSTFNFGPVHERRKSILKSTIVFAWSDILKRVTKVYKDFAEMI